MSNSHANQLNALVVEDYEVSSMIIKDMLSMIGIECQIATNKEEALENIQNQVFNVVFMDIQLGAESGLDISKEIRNMDIEQPLIIACTANNAITSKEEVIEAGMDDVLIKPVNIQAFKDMLAKHGMKINS